MRKAALIGLSLRIATHHELEASIASTFLAASIKARRSLLLAIAFSVLTFSVQLLIADFRSATLYALRVYLLVSSIGSAAYKTSPEEALSVMLRFRLPRSLCVIGFLTHSYVHRLTNVSIDAKLVSERKYDSLMERLRGALVGMMNSIGLEALALAELIEVYLKTPMRPPESHAKGLLTFILAALAQTFFLLDPLALRSSTG